MALFRLPASDLISELQIWSIHSHPHFPCTSQSKVARVLLFCLFIFTFYISCINSHHIPHLSIQSCPQFSHSQSISAGWHVVVLFKREPRLNILNMGSTALCEYSTALRARPIFWKIPTFYLQHSSLTPLHVKCSPIEISPRALQFLASVPNIQIYCIVPP